MDLHKLSRPELLKTCKDLEIKGVNALRKEEMIEKINEHQTNQRLPDFLQQLLKTIQTDMKRKVCKQCGELGHNVTSIKCIMNAEQNKRRIESIKEYLSSVSSISNLSFHIKSGK